jgi:hypothetical protein
MSHEVLGKRLLHWHPWRLTPLIVFTPTISFSSFQKSFSIETEKHKHKNKFQGELM